MAHPHNVLHLTCTRTCIIIIIKHTPTEAQEIVQLISVIYYYVHVLCRHEGLNEGSANLRVYQADHAH